MTNPLSKYKLTQSWEEHIQNTGNANRGGEDYATPYGTALPVLEGAVEYVTPATPANQRPAWYNTGLGNAVAYRRPDGTRTVFGHLSRIDGRQAYSGNSGTVRPAPTPANPHAGSHVHAHDVAADGITRLRPFTTIPDRKKNPMIALVPITDGKKRTGWRLVGITGKTADVDDRTAGFVARVISNTDGGMFGGEADIAARAIASVAPELTSSSAIEVQAIADRVMAELAERLKS